jgi:hypothetical protein
MFETIRMRKESIGADLICSSEKINFYLVVFLNPLFFRPGSNCTAPFEKILQYIIHVSVFQILLTLDDDLAEKPRDKIPVF